MCAQGSVTWWFSLSLLSLFCQSDTISIFHLLTNTLLRTPSEKLTLVVNHNWTIWKQKRSPPNSSCYFSVKTWKALCGASLSVLGPQLKMLRTHERKHTPLSKQTLGFIKNKLDWRICVLHSNCAHAYTHKLEKLRNCDSDGRRMKHRNAVKLMWLCWINGNITSQVSYMKSSGAKTDKAILTMNKATLVWLILPAGHTHKNMI